MFRGAGKGSGLRCQICTGCGLCPGAAVDRLQVEVAASGAETGRGQAEADSSAAAENREKGRILHVLAEDALLGKKFPLKAGGRRLVTADIGTTTIAMLLYHEDGSVADRYVAVNPQTMYGADVLSRIREARRPEHAHRMRKQVEEVLEKGLERFSRELAEGESLSMVLAANTTMTYLFMGWDAEELGQAPFEASRLGAVERQVAGVPCFVFPGLSAFVGVVIAGCIYACRMEEREELTLLVDLGTNGEMVLGNRHRRVACATAAGPAFEGGANAGIWGADMVSLLARLLEENVMDATGLLAPEYFDKGIRIGNVLVTQGAVRSIQLAKAAIAAGIEILLEKYGIRGEQVDRVVLAGGFGYYLRPTAAARIGLLPKELADKAVTGGNTALAGALLAGRRILSGETMADAVQGEGDRPCAGTGIIGSAAHTLAVQLERMAGDTEVVNLAMEAGFDGRYVENMDFPHWDVSGQGA